MKVPCNNLTMISKSARGIPGALWDKGNLHNHQTLRSMDAMDVVSQHGDFVEHYKTYRHKIYTYLYYRVNRDTDTAEDLTSEVFVKAYEAFARYDKSYAFSTWIYTIARNRLTDYYRANKYDISIDDIEMGEEPDELYALIDQELDLKKVEEKIEGLSDTQRSVITARFFEDKSTDEIAEQYEMSNDAVRQNISRGIKALRKSLAEALVSLLILLNL